MLESENAETGGGAKFALVSIRLPVALTFAGAAQVMAFGRPGHVQQIVMNLVQNAVDFARHRVWIDASWTERSIRLQIIDDGNGFPPGLIGRIGDHVPLRSLAVYEAIGASLAMEGRP